MARSREAETVLAGDEQDLEARLESQPNPGSDESRESRMEDIDRQLERMIGSDQGDDDGDEEDGGEGETAAERQRGVTDRELARLLAREGDDDFEGEDDGEDDQAEGGDPNGQGQLQGGQEGQQGQDEALLEQTRRFGETWARAFTENPAAAVQRAINAIRMVDPGQADALLASLGVQGGQEGDQGARFDPTQYDPASEFEQEMLQHYDDVKAMPEVRQTVAQMAEVNDNLVLRLLAQEQMINALLEMNGTNLPRFDQPTQEAVWNAIQANPQADPQEIIRQVYGTRLTEAVRVGKQVGKDRPRTLRAGSSTRKISSIRDAKAVLRKVPEHERFKAAYLLAEQLEG